MAILMSLVSGNLAGQVIIFEISWRGISRLTIVQLLLILVLTGLELNRSVNKAPRTPDVLPWHELHRRRLDQQIR
jgi:hypothetical protein